jgi:glycosyltransferase involved in cell wall biosynthesis
MRVAHTFKDFYPPLPAGITCYIADVSAAMASRGHQVDVHVAGVHRSRRERLPSGVVVHRHREYGRVMSMPLAPGLIREARTLDADVLHVHLPNPIGELGAALNTSAPIISSFHAQLGKQRFMEPLYAPLRRRIFGRAHVILVSNAVMAGAAELRGFEEKVRVLPYGVSPRLLLVGDQKRSVDRALRLLFVGRLVYYKGVDVLLRAIKGLDEVVLEIVGDGSDRAGLESLAKELGIAERVQFSGTVSDDELASAYSTADAFVLPSVSRAEAFGLALTEAMACGLPAISTSVGTGTDWVNSDGVTGLVVPPNDVAALADAIDALRDPYRRRTLGQAARDRTQALFSFDHHIDALEELYSKAVS